MQTALPNINPSKVEHSFQFEKTKMICVPIDEEKIEESWPPVVFHPRLDAINSIKGSLHTKREMDKAKKYGVYWSPDKSSLSCEDCDAIFSHFKRRHHCRVCGKIICDTCSPYRTIISGCSSRPKRSCKSCISILKMMIFQGDSRANVDTPIPSNCMPKLASYEHNPERELSTVLLAKQHQQEGKKEFIISCEWLERWLRFANVEGPGISWSSFGTSSSTPGCITNFTLLDFVGGKLFPKSNLIQSTGGCGDFRVINEEVWEVLFGLYGGGPAIYRDVASPTSNDKWNIVLDYKKHSTSENEEDSNRATISEGKHIKANPTRQFSFNKLVAIRQSWVSNSLERLGSLNNLKKLKTRKKSNTIQIDGDFASTTTECNQIDEAPGKGTTNVDNNIVPNDKETVEAMTAFADALAKSRQRISTGFYR